MIRVYPVTPVPAPRQTRRDALPSSARYPVRPPVARYRAYCDEIKIRRVQIPHPFHHAIFVLPMPDSWSTRKKQAHEGMPHQCKPDRDNLEKALLDAVLGEDAQVWDGRTTKLWGWHGLLIISDATYHFIPPLNLRPMYAKAGL